MRVEISVEPVDGVRVAARAGAARAELCAGLSDGGLTPSAVLIEAAAELAEVHVLVRPRPGDFHYSRDEVDLVVRDIAAARRRGAAGVVVGALAGDGTGRLCQVRRRRRGAGDDVPPRHRRQRGLPSGPGPVGGPGFHAGADLGPAPVRTRRCATHQETGHPDECHHAQDAQCAEE